MNSLATIRKFQTARFSIVVDAVEDYGYSLDDLATEPDTQQEINEKLTSGEWQLFTVRARAFLDGREIASDYLGGCIYADPAEFQDHRECGKTNREWAAQGKSGCCGSYFSDMVHNVCREARQSLRDMQSVKVRPC